MAASPRSGCKNADSQQGLNASQMTVRPLGAVMMAIGKYRAAPRAARKKLRARNCYAALGRSMGAAASITATEPSGCSCIKWPSCRKWVGMPLACRRCTASWLAWRVTVARAPRVSPVRHGRRSLCTLALYRHIGCSGLHCRIAQRRRKQACANGRSNTAYGGDRCHIAAMYDRRCLHRLPHH